MRFIDRLMPMRKPIVIGYLLLTTLAAGLMMASIGRDVLPKVNGSQFQVRLRAAEGTRIERTEAKTLHAIKL
jgi:multidrug efflux pump subunit AcrB